MLCYGQNLGIWPFFKSTWALIIVSYLDLFYQIYPCLPVCLPAAPTLPQWLVFFLHNIRNPSLTKHAWMPVIYTTTAT